MLLLQKYFSFLIKTPFPTAGIKGVLGEAGRGALKLLLHLKLQAANTEPGLQGGSGWSIARPPSSPLASCLHPIPLPQHPPAAELGRNHLILLLCRASGWTRARWINTSPVYLSRSGSEPGAGQFLFR